MHVCHLVYRDLILSNVSCSWHVFFFFFIGQSKAQQSTAPAPTVRPLQSQNGSDGKEMNTNIYLIYLV